MRNRLVRICVLLVLSPTVIVTGKWAIARWTKGNSLSALAAQDVPLSDDKPKITTDYAARITELSAASQASGVNGWPLIAEALDAMKSAEAAMRQSEGFDPATPPFESLFRTEPRGTQLEIARKMSTLLEASGAFDRLRDSWDSPQLVAPWVFDVTTPLWQQAGKAEAEGYGLAHLAIWRAKWSIDGHNLSALLSALKEGGALSRAYGHTPFGIDFLRAASINARVADLLAEATLHGEIASADATRVLAAFEKYFATPSVKIALEGERIVALDVVQRVYTDDGNGDGALIPSQLGSLIGSNVENAPTTPVESSTRQAELVTLDDAYGSLVSAIGKPSGVLKSLESELSGRKYQDGMRHPVAGIMVPTLSQLLSHDNFVRTKVNCARLVLALECYRDAHGAYPESLAALIPEFLASNPADCVSGQPFVYSRVGAGTSFRSYRLYSLGLDAKDQGGKPRADDPNMALHEGGFDYVINAGPVVDVSS